MRERLNKSVDKLAERFEFMSIRERGLIVLTIIALVFITWDTYLMAPLGAQQTHTINEMQDLSKKLEKVARQMKLMTYTQKNEPKIQERIEEIKQLLVAVKEEQNGVSGEFVSPEHMNTMLQDMLDAEKNLRLKELKSLGVAPLRAGDLDALRLASKDSSQPIVYKHGLHIVFEGDFFSTLRYLKALEAMPWRFYWDKVDYNVVDFPRAEVSIIVHTLSLNEWWIGV